MQVAEQGRTIGELAEAGGVHVETVRYYERRGLLSRPRRAAGWRRYDEQALRTLRFVKRAQELGFSLDEIRGLLALRSSASIRTCDRVRAQAVEKLAEVEAKIRDLAGIRAVLEELTRACPSDGPAEHCPILRSLSSSQPKNGACCDG